SRKTMSASDRPRAAIVVARRPRTSAPSRPPLGYQSEPSVSPSAGLPLRGSALSRATTIDSFSTTALQEPYAPREQRLTKALLIRRVGGRPGSLGSGRELAREGHPSGRAGIIDVEAEQRRCQRGPPVCGGSGRGRRGERAFELERRGFISRKALRFLQLEQS